MSLHPLDEDLELYYLLRLSPQFHSSIESHISECELCGEKIKRMAQSARDEGVGVSAHLPDVRIMLDGGVSIRVLAGSALPGRIIHHSENEMKLGLSDPVLPGIFVQIRVGTRIIMGQVRECVPSGQEFHATVEIESIFLIPVRNPSGADPE